jgi:2-polyprenyl-3-methyl-5-hydroxy-6-metoxy-1,4-benzoquinol methylase
MPPSADVIRADFDRIARVSECVPDNLEPVARRLVADVPLRVQVLDIGCGTGALARELAQKRGAKVTAIDLAPRMIDVARLRTSQTLRVDYRVADIMELSPRGFDVAIAVNTLHHLPLAEIVERMANAVVPGGQVLIADLFTAPGLLDLPYNALSWLATSRSKSPELREAWKAHGEHDELSPFRVIRATLREVLPGVVVRRHLGWRYTAVWTKP